MLERIRAGSTSWMLMATASLGLTLGLGACANSEDAAAPVECVLVVAVESLGWERVDALLERGELPHLARLVQEGVRTEVLAPDPLTAPSLWATAFTGMDLKTHRVAGELAYLPDGTRTLVPSVMRESKHLLQIVGDAGHTVASVGLPGTWPAEMVNGFVLSPGAVPSRWTLTEEHTARRDPATQASFPPSLFAEVKPLLRDPGAIRREDAARFFTLNEREYAMLYDEPLGSIYRKTNPVRDFGITYQRDLSHVDVTLELMERYAPKLVTVHLELLDAVLPAYWPFAFPDRFETPADSRRRFGKTIDEAYRFVDAQIGRLVQALPPRSTVIVVGDRGFGTETLDDGSGPRTVAIHQNRAAMVLWGQGIAREKELPRAGLADLTPTVLALLGIPVGVDMTGSVLTGALQPDFAAAHPRRSIESHDTDWDRTQRYPPGVAESFDQNRERP